ncbi:MAG: hypothetical protein QXO16_03145 [Archaeoglobaceae archaeon]
MKDRVIDFGIGKAEKRACLSTVYYSNDNSEGVAYDTNGSRNSLQSEFSSKGKKAKRINIPHELGFEEVVRWQW